MAIRDVYLLKRSDGFHLNPRQEVTVDLALKRAPILPCTILSGQVIDNCGPLPGATVKVFLMNYAPVLHAMTDANGRFLFRNVLYPGCYRVIATADGYSVSEDTAISLEPDEPVKIVKRLNPSNHLGLAAVYGVVRDPLGNAISNADICVLDDRRPERTVAITHTNHDGEYLVVGLKPRKYEIIARKHGYIFPQPTFFECYPNEIVPLDLFMYEDIQLRNGTVSGIIKFGGNPVPHAAVALYRVEDNRHELIRLQEANREGVYLFADVKPGNYLVKAELDAPSVPDQGDLL